ncbi:PREDICTED: killer cell immunoglobulin-like receptor 2DL4 [Ceratotherium simum simum]|uniref:Killer cell immunoglobulin-like receptor 2DL4 n=1 Tax=Ceratotherium simum simum TaxID=73337 RepID=A0ABM1DD00_CERSS|nr:PREDICTED: killer cell immunoglobulin-like receptor 2DL4 [Ceratotherium simum simum]
MSLVTTAHAGIYGCSITHNHIPSVWSGHIDTLEIVVTGIHKEPSLSGQVVPVVMSGENLNFFCEPEISFDKDHISREEEAHEQQLTRGQSRNSAFQAIFPLGPVTPAHSRTYSGYGSFNHSPCAWSDLSDPLQLSVTDAA